MPQEPAPQAPSPGAVAFFVVAKSFETIGLAMKYGTYCVLAYFAYLSIIELAGKTTITNMALSYVTSKEGSPRLIPWFLTVGAMIWGYTERHLRLKKILAMGTHNAELERRLDPGRSSSRLTTKGETGPGDQDL